MRYARIDWTDPENPRVRSFHEYAQEPQGIKQENGYPVLVPSSVEDAPSYDRNTEIRKRTESITAQGHSVTYTVRPMTPEELEARAEQRRREIEERLPDAALKRHLRGVVDVDDVDTADLADYVPLYRQWRPEDYEAGEILGFGETTLLRVIQPHTALAHWNPLEIPAIYQVLAPDEGGDYPTWQDWGGNPDNLYMEGQRVTHNGRNWESRVDNNAHEPTEANWAAWLLLEDE